MASEKPLNLLTSSSVDHLLTKIEEAARSTKEGVKYFIEPAHGTLSRASSRRHHIIFGRRGSGKSSLLRKAGADLTVDRRPIAYINLEAFKVHSYPDILLSVLLSTFKEFDAWLESAGIFPATKTSFWSKLFGSVPSRPSLNRRECEGIQQRLKAHIKDLEVQLHAPEEARVKEELSGEQTLAAGISAGGGPTVPFRAEINTVNTAGKNKSAEFKEKKIDFLHRHIIDYQGVFSDLAKLSKGDAYLFLDDLYQIKRTEQPMLIDYFHRIGKDNSLWLKIGTIRHRTDWYSHGNPPIGLKLGDDADEIDLDLTLEKYSLAKGFLLKILDTFAKETQVALNDILTDGAKDRLVLASGGVARDFLSIFRKAIHVARERHGGHRGESVTVEDVNLAAGEYDTTKREEFKTDASEDSKALSDIFQEITNFCLNTANSNCFLLDKNSAASGIKYVHELVDLKLFHLVRSRVTLKTGKQGQIYEAYMLDVSQYAGSRKRRDLQAIEFWKADQADESLRRNKLVYPL